MSYQIVCLANSWKHKARCVAGKIVSGKYKGYWVRPVGNREENRAILDAERQYATGGFAVPLDVMQISFSAKQEGTFQQENLIISGEKWQRVGRLTIADLAGYMDSPDKLWENGHDSTYGTNDKVPSVFLASPIKSLYLIRPENVHIRVAMEHGDKPKVRVFFDYNGVKYGLTATDSSLVFDYQNRAVGSYQLANISYLTISLGEKLPSGDSYKLIAHAF
jgi:hypothetical protein|uniref:dual OB domain-containing protein n=1 Tax=Pseudomonas TaxID=286 RepID=UPI00054C2DE0|nr:MULTISPECIES: hypothetical protein [Pseudomonas]MDN6865362.1 hypothetical protein [Pseudomonas rhodesiae]POA55200.1 hypothetical protein C1885_20380 [Pseudomonas sp. GW531-R1]WHT79763.1 hypothetical protein QMY54_04576 [Pseudomonas rhodesiae]